MSLFFYGHAAGKPYNFLSNFYVVPGGFYFRDLHFPTSEHAMMFSKAALMGDSISANLIKTAKTPLEAKKLGRKVKPFDQNKWERDREELMTAILVAKFSKSEMKKLLLDIGESVCIYEASPRDKIWGIGLCKERAEAGEAHRGKNLLGKCLMRARAQLA